MIMKTFTKSKVKLDIELLPMRNLTPYIISCLIVILVMLVY